MISTSTTQVEGGVVLVKEVGALLERIAGQVTEISAVVADIATSAKGQSTDLQEINTAVTEMDQMTQQNAAIAVEASASSQSLRKGGEQLSALVGEFQFGNRSGASIRSELAKVAPHAFRSPNKDIRSPRASDVAPVRPTAAHAPRTQGVAAVAANAETGWTEF